MNTQVFRKYKIITGSARLTFTDMKNIIVLFLLVIPLGHLFAQDTALDTDQRSKIESARIALITERLGLTPDEAEKFWPLYNEFIEKRKGLRNEYNTAKSKLDPNTASEQEKKDLLNLGLKLKERQVDLEKNYSERMMKVISAQQVMALRKAEEDFRRMLLEQLERRRDRMERRQQIRENNADRIRPRDN